MAKPIGSPSVRAKWVGQIVNGWEVIEVLPHQKALLRCKTCGRTKTGSREGIKNQSIRPCVCRVEHLEPKTETQARVYTALLRNKGNGAKAAKELGMSRQAVHSVLDTMRKNNP